MVDKQIIVPQKLVINGKNQTSVIWDHCTSHSILIEQTMSKWNKTKKLEKN